MQLSVGQIRDFDEYGYLFFPNCFSEEEIALLREDAEVILKLDRQEMWREKTGAPRTAFAAHTFNEPHHQIYTDRLDRASRFHANRARNG
jgi:ectoine hydroxylase